MQLLVRISLKFRNCKDAFRILNQDNLRLKWLLMLNLWNHAIYFWIFYNGKLKKLEGVAEKTTAQARTLERGEGFPLLSS